MWMALPNTVLVSFSPSLLPSAVAAISVASFGAGRCCCVSRSANGVRRSGVVSVPSGTSALTPAVTACATRVAAVSSVRRLMATTVESS
jgi:hypothetical protein